MGEKVFFLRIYFYYITIALGPRPKGYDVMKLMSVYFSFEFVFVNSVSPADKFFKHIFFSFIVHFRGVVICYFRCINEYVYRFRISNYCRDSNII